MPITVKVGDIVIFAKYAGTEIKHKNERYLILKEADLLMDNSLWQSASGLPFITQEVWDDLVAVQTERNKVLYKAKEVLGDE